MTICVMTAETRISKRGEYLTVESCIQTLTAFLANYIPQHIRYRYNDDSRIMYKIITIITIIRIRFSFHIIFIQCNANIVMATQASEKYHHQLELTIAASQGRGIGLVKFTSSENCVYTRTH